MTERNNNFESNNEIFQLRKERDGFVKVSLFLLGVIFLSHLVSCERGERLIDREASMNASCVSACSRIAPIEEGERAFFERGSLMCYCPSSAPLRMDLGAMWVPND